MSLWLYVCVCEYVISLSVGRGCCCCCCCRFCFAHFTRYGNWIFRSAHNRFVLHIHKRTNKRTDETTINIRTHLTFKMMKPCTEKMQNYWIVVKTDYDENDDHIFFIRLCHCHYATLFTPSNRKWHFTDRFIFEVIPCACNLTIESSASEMKTNRLIKQLENFGAKAQKFPQTWMLKMFANFFFGNLVDRITSKYHP